MSDFTFSDLLTKIGNIFKNDMYILNSKYCLGGSDSEERNTSTILCLLTEDSSNAVKEIFNDAEVVYIKDVKKAKNDLESFSSLKIFDNEKEELLKRRNTTLDMIMKIDNWNSFNFTEEIINDIFNEGLSYELFTDNDDIPNVTISKSIFPMVKDKVVDKLFYQTIIPENPNDLNILMTSFDTDWFQIYSVVHYITTDKE